MLRPPAALLSPSAARDLLRAAAASGSWVLAADPGSTKIGVAACAASAGGASAARAIGALRAPPRPLPQRERNAALAAQLAALARGGLGAGRRVGLVLVGLPLAPDGRPDGGGSGGGGGGGGGSSGGQAGGCARAEALAARLRALGVAAPTVLWDERGSSAAARARLRAEGVEEARRRLFGGGSALEHAGRGGGGGGGGGFADDTARSGGGGGGGGGGNGGSGGSGGGDTAITRALRLRQRAVRALPPGVRERVDGEAAVEILQSFLAAAAEAEGREE